MAMIPMSKLEPILERMIQELKDPSATPKKRRLVYVTDEDGNEIVNFAIDDRDIDALTFYAIDEDDIDPISFAEGAKIVFDAINRTGKKDFINGKGERIRRYLAIQRKKVHDLQQQLQNEKEAD